MVMSRSNLADAEEGSEEDQRNLKNGRQNTHPWQVDDDSYDTLTLNQIHVDGIAQILSNP